MKRNLQVFLVLLFAILSNTLSAQLPNGSIAPDWTLTDLNGDTYNLYDELDAGKSIILDISATWCPPCWSYHNNGILESLYEDYGPNGTDQIRVFMVEGDNDTNLACLSGSAGCDDSTMGDWITGTQYPIFSPEATEANAFISSYQLGFWPTLYGISPIDKTTQLVGLASYASWESWLIDSWQMSASATTFDSDCPSEGMVDIEISNGFGSLDYSWSNGATTQDLVDISAGTYAVTITDDHNVSISIDNIVVGGTSAPAIALSEIENSPVDCNGNSTGVLQVIASGGSGGFSYQWSNGLEGSFIDNLSEGDYEVTCTDVNGCTLQKSFSILEPELLSMGTFITSTTCGEENGFASLTATGGTLPYSYDLGFGAQSNGTFISLAPGNYNAKITDGNGCEMETLLTIDNSEAPIALAEAPSSITCLQPTVPVTAANSSYIGNVDYNWTTPDGLISGSTDSESIMASAAGTYNLTLIEISTGCISESSAIVIDNSDIPLIVIADIEEVNCNSPQILIDASASAQGDNLTYMWSTSDGNIIGDTDSNKIDVDMGGTYTLSIVNGDTGCMSSQAVSVVSDIEVPSINVSNALLTCASPQIEVCATIDAGHSVLWTTSTGSVSETCITVSVDGEYVATVTAPNGCTNSATSVVTSSTEVPLVSLESSSVITCTQETVLITAVVEDVSSDDIIIWTDSNGNIIGEEISEIVVSEPGVYEVSVTNNLGCSAISSIMIEENINTPIASFDYSVDPDGVVTLNSTSDESGSVTWTLGDGTVLTGEDSVFSVPGDGEYEVCMSYANECGTDEFCQIVVYSSLLAVTTNKVDLSCHQSADGSISAAVTGGSEGYSYYWQGPDGFESTESSISFLAAGTYVLLVTDGEGTEIDSEVTIIEPEELRAMQEAITNTTCNGGIDGSIQLDMIGGIAPYSYQWSDGDVTANRSDLPAGEYGLVVVDGNGCEFSKTYTVTEPDAISIISVIASDEQNGLANGTIELQVTGGSGDLIYQWSNGASTANIDNLQGGEYSVVITDSNGCSIELGGITINTITNISDFEKITEFSMYPVPAQTFLNVEAKLNTTQAVSFKVFNITGHLIWSKSYYTSEINEIIDLNTFAPGIYTLSVTSAGNIQSDNFIVVK